MNIITRLLRKLRPRRKPAIEIRIGGLENFASELERVQAEFAALKAEGERMLNKWVTKDST